MAYGVTTEWDDIHVRLGNYEPHPKETTQAELTKQALEKCENYDPLKQKELEELKELEDEFMDDDYYQSYVNSKYKQIEENKKRAIYGQVYEISKADYVKEVNEANKDSFVIILLYQEYLETCQLMKQIVAKSAENYPFVKFVQSVATRCIEKFPDDECPCIIIYKAGQMKFNLQRMDKKIDLNVKAFSLLLKAMGIVELAGNEEQEEIMKYQKFTGGKLLGTQQVDQIDDSKEDDREYAVNYIKHK